MIERVRAGRSPRGLTQESELARQEEVTMLGSIASDENARSSTSSSVKAIGPSKGMNPARTLGSTGNHKGNVPDKSLMIPAHQLGAIKAVF
jgi:hypothetical protein